MNANYYLGTPIKITLNDCFKMPEQLTEQLKSIQTKNICVRLYTSSMCLTIGPSVKTFELRPGTPYHNNLEKWKLPKIRAISLCSYNCPENRNENLPPKSQVFLFSKINFKGSINKLNLSAETCSNTSQGNDGVPRSLLIREGTCAILFSEDECTGMNHTVKVSVYNFNVVTKSISLCSYTTPQPSTMDPSDSSTEIQINIKSTTKKPDTENFTGLPLPTIAIICTAFLVGMILLTLAVMCLKNKLVIKVRQRLSESEVKDFFNGSDINLVTSDSSDQPSPELVAQSRPYNKQYEISRSKIAYGKCYLIKIFIY